MSQETTTFGIDLGTTYSAILKTVIRQYALIWRETGPPRQW